MQILNVAWFTFFQATLSTFVALLIGLPAAFFCGRRKFPLRKALLSISTVPFCVPTLIVALGYVTFLGLNGGLNHFLMFIFGLKEPPLKILYSFVGLIIAHGFYNFPIIMKTVSDAWERLPSEPSECARLLGAGEGRIFRTITIFQLIPSIASSSLLVFIYTFLSFIFVLLFGGIGNTTLEVEIYKAARATLDFSMAGKLAVVETLILCAVTVLYCLLEQKSSRSKGTVEPESWKRLKLGAGGAGEIVAFVILILVIILGFIAPLLGIVWNAFTSPKTGSRITLATFTRVIKMRSFWPSAKWTLVVGLCTGTLCMLTGFAYSILLKFLEDKTGKSLDVFLKIFPMLPMSISSVVVGVVITMLVRRGNIWCLIFAQTALTWPLAFRQIYPQMVKITKDTMDSARLLSRNKADIIWRVLLPVCRSSLFSAFAFCFAVSAGDTTLPLVLAIPKLDTLSLFTYRLAGSYRFNEACASGFMLGILCILIFVGGKKWRIFRHKI